MARGVLQVWHGRKAAAPLNEHRTPSQPFVPTPAPDALAPHRQDSSLPVGDVLVRRDAAGYGIFNYRGEPVLEAPVKSPAEAARLAAEIVSPWHGRVRIDEPLLGH